MQSQKALDHSADNQLGLWLNRISIRARGITEGAPWAAGIFWKKADKLFLDRASAASFVTPAMCSTDKVMLDRAHMKKRHLSRCIAVGWMLACVLVYHNNHRCILAQTSDVTACHVAPPYGARDDNWQ